jgi:hypothetical protein
MGGSWVGVGLPLKTLDKAKTLSEVGEVGVVQQVGKVRAEPTEKAKREKVRESKNRSWSINPHLPHPTAINCLYTAVSVIIDPVDGGRHR